MSALNYIKNNQVSLFFIFLLFFPTFRLLILGSGHASGVGLVVSLLPEIVFCSIVFLWAKQLIQAKDRKIMLIDKLVFCYLVLNVALGIYLAQHVKASLYGFRLTYLPMLAYFLASFYQSKEVSLEKSLNLFFKFLVFIALIGIVIYFFLPQIHVYFHHLTTDKGIAKADARIVRMTSLFWTPVVFGMMMLSGFLYWLYSYYSRGKTTDLIYAGIVCFALIFSISRGPIIAAIPGFIILSVYARNLRRMLAIIGVVSVNVILISYLTYENGTTLFSWILSSANETLTLTKDDTRVGLWKKVVYSLQHHPMGLGLGRAGHAAVQNFTPGTKNVSFESTDGWYLKLMIETGVLALVSYLTISFSFFIKLIQFNCKKTLNWNGFVLALFVATGLVNVVSNANDFYLFSYVYWLLLGTFIYRLKQEKNEKSLSSHS